MATMRRIYLPLDRVRLESLRADRELPGDVLSGFAVTAAATAAQPGVDDDEVHEFAATQSAARAALAGDASVVAAADVAAADVEEDVEQDTEDNAVRVRGPLPLKRFASFHLIDRAVAEADPDAAVELSWFDATELDLLLEVIDRG